MIIGLAGARGVGKDYNAELLVKKGFKHIKFAGLVMNKLMRLTRMSKEEIFSRKEANEDLYLFGKWMDYREAMNAMDITPIQGLSYVKGVVERDPWNSYVISDVRTKEGYEWLFQEGYVIEVTKEGVEYTNTFWDRKIPDEFLDESVDTYKLAKRYSNV